MRVHVLIDPSPAERAVVEAALPDATWAVDGAAPGHAGVVLSFMPRRELAGWGLDWSDLGDLRLLQLCSAGANHVPWSDLPAGVEVGVAPGGSADAVSEHVLAQALWWSRRLGEHDADIRAGRFNNGAPVTALAEHRVLIVGHGGIGRAVVERFTAFGCAVRAVSRTPNAAYVMPMDQLDDGLAWADIVVLALPLTPATNGLIDAGRLARLTGRALLINVARGPIVDEDALFDWLAEPEHAAALDVWWKYPVTGGHPFTRPFHTLPNVLMTPHDAPNVTDFRVPMLQAACQHIRTWLDTGRVPHPVTRGEADVDGDGR